MNKNENNYPNNYSKNYPKNYPNINDKLNLSPIKSQEIGSFLMSKWREF